MFPLNFRHFILLFLISEIANTHHQVLLVSHRLWGLFPGSSYPVAVAGDLEIKPPLPGHVSFLWPIRDAQIKKCLFKLKIVITV